MNQQNSQTKKQTIVEWLNYHKLKTNKLQPIEFRDHKFLWDFLNDTCRRIVIKKCTQVGATFTAIIKTLFQGDLDPISIVYTLPTAGDVKDLVTSKFDPIVENSELLSEKIEKDPFSRRAVFSTTLKRIGNTHFFFRGSWTERAAQQIDADILVVDELDFQKPDIRKMYEERLEGSGSKDIIYWLGVPTFPRYGISDIYEKSDQREWWIECPHCYLKQILEFPANISFQKKTYVCQKCRLDLSNDVRRNGRWIAKYPGRPIHGYHFTRLMAPWIPASKIIRSYRRDKPKHFYNYTLGKSYLEKTQQLRKDEMKQLRQTEFDEFKRERVICGIDQGNYFHLVSSFVNQYGILVVRAEVCRSASDLESKLEAFKPTLTVMDRYPDQHYAKKLQDKFGLQKFLLVNQRLWSLGRAEKVLEFIRSKGAINLERTEALDKMYDSIRKGFIKFYSLMPGLDTMELHLRNLIPDIQEIKGKKRKIYKTIGRDDFAQALDYLFVGFTILYPESDLKPSYIIPAAKDPGEARVGSPRWKEEDFQKQIKRFTGGDSVIVIPPKSI